MTMRMLYCFGASEEYFGRILERNPGLRNKIMIQSKCALIRDTEKTLYIDTTKEHIIESVENSMKRLKVDHLDSFLLHRADTLMEPGGSGRGCLTFSTAAARFGISVSATSRPWI